MHNSHFNWTFPKVFAQIENWHLKSIRKLYWQGVWSVSVCCKQSHFDRERDMCASVRLRIYSVYLAILGGFFVKHARENTMLTAFCTIILRKPVGVPLIGEIFNRKNDEIHCGEKIESTGCWATLECRECRTIEWLKRDFVRKVPWFDRRESHTLTCCCMNKVRMCKNSLSLSRDS